MKKHQTFNFRLILLTIIFCELSTGHSRAAATNNVARSLSATNPAVNVATDSEESEAAMRQEAYNQTRQDLYGKVVDQDGHPVAGVDVTGTARQIEGFKEKFTTSKTQTDAAGLFQFTGLHGVDMGADVSKAGYEIDYKRGVFEPSGQSSPTNRVVYTMWKLKGAEPMVHVKLHSYIPCDGTETRFDLLTGKKSTNGDLIVSLTRNPLNIDRKKPFDWTLTLQITNGGFQAVTNIYPNEAPADGYQSNVFFHYESGSSNWTSQIQPQLYFKGKNGQSYGRMNLKVMTDFQPPPTLFDAEIYANPGGSRNLEFDPAKQIRQ